MTLLRDQIVIQIGDEIDGMVMIRSGDNRQGVCPVKFLQVWLLYTLKWKRFWNFFLLQEVWQRIEMACQADNPCNCAAGIQKPQSKEPKQPKKPETTLKKIYYPVATPQNRHIFRNNNNTFSKPIPKKDNNSGSILRYYYNNFAKGRKDTNVYQNAVERRRNELAFLHGKAPFSSTKRPLSIRLSTPKHVASLFNRSFTSDSQKRPLLLQGSPYNYEYRPTPHFQIIANKDGLKISSIYTISESVEKFSFHRKNLYISSNSRPLFVRKWYIFPMSKTYFCKCNRLSVEPMDKGFLKTY